MSFSIFLFHPSVRKMANSGQDLDAFQHPQLDPGAVDAFRTRLLKYGYSVTLESHDLIEYSKVESGMVVEARIFDTEICFSVPYQSRSNEAIFLAMQDASELNDGADFALYDPQADEWLS